MNSFALLLTVAHYGCFHARNGAILHVIVSEPKISHVNTSYQSPIMLAGTHNETLLWCEMIGLDNTTTWRGLKF